MPGKKLVKRTPYENFLSSVKNTVLKELSLTRILSQDAIEQLTQHAINKSYTKDN